MGIARHIRSAEEIRSELAKLYRLVQSPDTPPRDKIQYQGSILALEWVKLKR